MYGLLLSQRSLARFLLQFGSSPRMRFAVYRAALFADCGVPALTFCDTSFCNAEHTASIDFHQPNFFIESFSETYKHYSHRQVESAIAVSELGAWRCRADTAQHRRGVVKGSASNASLGSFSSPRADSIGRVASSWRIGPSRDCAVTRRRLLLP